MFMPGWLGALDRAALDWKPRCVGGPLQWIRRGAAFLDVLTPTASEATVALIGAGAGSLLELVVESGRVLRVRPSVFVGAVVSSLAQVRYVSQWLPFRELALEGRRRWFIVKGPAKVYLFLTPTAVCLDLAPGEGVDVPPEYLAAVPVGGVRETLVGLSLRHYFTGRPAYTKRLTNEGQKPCRVVLAHPLSGADRVVIHRDQSGIAGLAIDVLSAAPIR